MITRIYLEVTTFCNFKCVYCPHPIMKRKREHIDWKLACNALQQIAENEIGEHIYFNYLGEPLLYPRLFDLIAYADALGLSTRIITNGSLLHSKNIDRIKATKLNELKISYETPDEKNFRLRRNKQFTSNGILKNILNTIDALKHTEKKIGLIFMTTHPDQKKGIDNVEIITCMPQLKNEIRKFTDLLAPITPIKSFKDINGELEKTDWFWWNPPIWLNENIFLEIRPMLNWGNRMTDKEIIPAKTGYCDALKEKIGILVNGDVVLCCIDYEGELSIGNIRQHSLADILSSETACNIRQEFESHNILLEKCRHCLGNPVMTCRI